MFKGINLIRDHMFKTSCACWVMWRLNTHVEDQIHQVMGPFVPSWTWCIWQLLPQELKYHTVQSSGLVWVQNTLCAGGCWTVPEIIKEISLLNWKFAIIGPPWSLQEFLNIFCLSASVLTKDWHDLVSKCSSQRWHETQNIGDSGQHRSLVWINVVIYPKGCLLKDVCPAHSLGRIMV